MPGVLDHLHLFYDTSSVLAPEVSCRVPMCNRFASLSDECATPAVLSDS